MKKLLGIFLLVIILIAGGLLIQRIGSGLLSESSDPFSSNIQVIEKLIVLDAHWSLAALAIYNNPDSNFDKLADFLPEIRKLRNTLEISDLQSSATPDAVKYQLRRFLLEIESKEDLIEQFKSNFSIVRNSLKYFPLASQTLTSKIRSKGEDAMTDEISGLYERTMAFLRNPSEGAKVRLLIDFNRMDEIVMSFPRDIAIPFGNFISHARVLVEQKILLNSIIEKLIGSQAKGAGDELLSIYIATRQKQLVRQQSESVTNIYISLALAATIILVSVLSAFLLWRKEYLFERKLASGIAEKTEHFENAKAKSNQSMVESNLDKNLEGMGRMAATIAHEINTPLGYLDGNLQVLHSGMKSVNTLFSEFTILKQALEQTSDIDAVKKRMEDFESILQSARDEAMLDEFPEIAEDMQEGIKQIQYVVNELKDFTRKDSSNKDWYDIEECIRSALKLASKEIPSTCKLEISLSGMPRMFGAPAEINQVLINLIVNASHAIIDAGRKKGYIRVKTCLEKGKVVVSVMDNGTGIDNEARKKIFDPFFTTKEVGKGTGLGLAIVRRVIMNHDGRVIVNSIEGKGSNFIIVLPVKPTTENMVYNNLVA